MTRRAPLKKSNISARGEEQKKRKRISKEQHHHRHNFGQWLCHHHWTAVCVECFRCWSTIDRPYFRWRSRCHGDEKRYVPEHVRRHHNQYSEKEREEKGEEKKRQKKVTVYAAYQDMTIVGVVWNIQIDSFLTFRALSTVKITPSQNTSHPVIS